jgi:hypothetical protein
MRSCCLVAVVLAGCSFDVSGVGPGEPGPPSVPTPTQSVPDQPDAATPPPTNDPTPPPPPMPPPPPDMAKQRIGTACNGDAQCDPGLTCAKTFFVGLTRIDIPGGYCTHECSQTACPADSYCGSFAFGKYCVSSCPPDPCRKDYQCCSNSSMKACLPDGLCGKGGDT